MRSLKQRALLMALTVTALAPVLAAVLPALPAVPAGAAAAAPAAGGCHVERTPAGWVVVC